MTDFPASIDTLPNPIASTQMDDVGYYHDVLHTNGHDAIIALQTKVGVDGSIVPESLDYKIAALATSLADAAEDIVAVAGDVVALTTEVSNLTDAVGALQTNVGELQSDIGDIETSIGQLQANFLLYLPLTGGTLTGMLAVTITDATGLTLTQSLTGAAANNAIDLALAWATSGAPTALKVNATGTSSSAALLCDFQLNSASVLNLRRDGRMILVGRLSATNSSGSIGHGVGISDAGASSSTIALVISHTLAAGPPASAGFGVHLDVNLDTSTTANQRAARWNTVWSDATHATRTALTTFLSLSNGSEVTNMIVGAGQVAFNVGSAGVPSIANRSNLDTGLYFNASLIAFSCDGVAQGWIGLNGFILSAMAAPSSDPSPNAVAQWSAAGEWQYRTSAASEGAGLTHRVHNRAAVVDCSGTDYAFTSVTTAVTFGTVSPVIVLPTAGTYFIFACAGVLSDAAGANDAMAIILYNSTDATSVGLGGSKVMTAGAGLISESTVIFAVYTVTASKTIVLRAVNSTAARGTLFAGRTNIGYIRLY